MIYIFNVSDVLSEYGLTVDLYEELLKDCSDKLNKTSDIDWSEISDKYNLSWNGDTLRKAQQPPLLGGAFVRDYYIWKNKNNKDENYDSTISTQIRELEKAKKKIQTEKIEYNKWLREDSRDELIFEKIIDAIKEQPKFDIPKKIELSNNSKSYLLCFGDAHYGAEYKINGLFGDVINEYSPEIFEDRMNLLLHKTIEIIEKENIKILNVFDLGDSIDGILRASQLMKLRYGVVDQAVKYAMYLSTWLFELSKYVHVKFQMTGGNHSQLRMIGQPKNTFTDDNMSKVIEAIIKTKLNDNPNFTYVNNYTENLYANLCGWTCIGIHGETKNMEKTLKNYSNIYNVSVNYLIAGHLHHGKQEDVGIDCEVINVPSIIGVDPYSLSIEKVSRAAAKLIVFDTAYGKTCEYTIVLN